MGIMRERGVTDTDYNNNNMRIWHTGTRACTHTQISCARAARGKPVVKILIFGLHVVNGVVQPAPPNRDCPGQER